MDPIPYYNLITNCPARLSLTCRLGNVLTDVDRFTVSLLQFIREASEHAHVHISAALVGVQPNMTAGVVAMLAGSGWLDWQPKS